MAKYKIELPVKNVPSDWTNYNRSVQVIESSAPSNYSKVILSESVGAENWSQVFEVSDGLDITVIVNLHDDSPEHVFKHTSGKFSSHGCDVCSVVRTDEPVPEPVVEPEPAVEPDPEPVVEPDPEPAVEPEPFPDIDHLVPEQSDLEESDEDEDFISY